MPHEQDRSHKWEKKKTRSAESGQAGESERRRRKLRTQRYAERKAKQDLDDQGISTTRPNRMKKKRSKHMKNRDN